MKKWIIAILLILLTNTNVSAEYFRDIIVNTSEGIWTDSRAYSSLSAAISAIGSNEQDLYIAQQEVVTSITIPENVRLHFLKDGKIANSGQLTINTKSIYAPNKQIFEGPGDIDFAIGSVVKSSWFSSASEAINTTNDDQLTLIISNSSFINEDCTVGNNVTLKWESPRNRLTISAGYTMSNIKNIEAGNYQLFAGAGDFDFLDGTVLNLSWFARLRSATTWIEDEEVTIEVRDPSTVDYDTTVSRNTTLKFAGSGAILTISAGKTLTVNGPWICGQHQSIAGTGTMVFGGGAVDYIYPQWWGGSDIADGTTEAASAINSALTTAYNSAVGGIVLLTMGSYNISSTLYIMSGTVLQGSGINATTIKSDDAISIIAFDPTVANDAVEGTYVKDLTVDGLDVANGGTGFEVITYDNGALIGVGSTRSSGIETVNIVRCAKGISFEGTQGFSLKGVKFGTGNASYGNTYGIYCSINDGVTNATSQQVSLYDCDFRHNDYGLYETYLAGSKAYGWLFSMCHFEGNEYGIVADNIVRWTFLNCKFEGNDNFAVDFEMPEFVLFEGCFFIGNSDVALGPQVYLEPVDTYTSPASISTAFKRCDFWKGSPATTYDVELSYAKNVLFEQCHFLNGNDRINTNNNSMYRMVDQHATEFFDPTLTEHKVISGWFTHTDSGSSVVVGVIPGPIATKNVYVEQVLIHVTEAFDLGGGSYTVIRVGSDIDAQHFSQSQDVTSTGIKTPVMNNSGYFEPGATYFKISVASDGVPTQGKALVVIQYFEVPLEP